MRVLSLINERTDLHAYQATTAIAVEIAKRGTAWVAGLTDVSLDPDGTVVFAALPVEAQSADEAVAALTTANPMEVRSTELDALLIRTNPGRDKGRTALHEAALNLCRVAKARGVVVLNDPDALPKASDKLFLTHLPESLRPKMLVSSDPARLRAFVEDGDSAKVLKPLFGSRGQGVFRVRPGGVNLNALIEVLTADGLVIAQQYLRRASEGDVRIVAVDGELLTVDGKVCAVRRVPPEGEFRSNIHVGSVPSRAELKAPRLRAARQIAELLADQGIWMAGIDLIGTKAVEINVRSPGGLGHASLFEGVDFTAGVVDSIERRLAERPSSTVAR
ncbi:MAG: hypothetical protein AB8I08_12115 [Sandaracinaceae bacterium]